METYLFSQKDTQILRDLALTVAEIASLPSQAKKIKLWTDHNDLKTTEPLIFIDPENGWNEIIRPEQIKCQHQIAKYWEMHLRKQIYWNNEIKDDTVIDTNFMVHYICSDNGFGVDINYTGGGDGKAYKVIPSIVDYETDFDKLHFPKLTIDYKESAKLLELAQTVFGDILNVSQGNGWWWSLGLTNVFIDLRGFENFLFDFIDEPDYLHKMMNFLCEGNLKNMDFLEENGLFSQNTGNHYVGSGGFGFTNHLAQVPTSQTVKTSDMWGFVESQETVSVSPEMYAEFIFPYHKRIADRFGLNCYGCCEPFEPRWDVVKTIKNLRRISCSPWSDRAKMEEMLGKNYIASIKLSPTPLALPVMDESVVRRDLREALLGAKNCIPELIMKDNNTLGNNPKNATRWVELAREEISNILG